jgi:hypothetical protein
MKRLALLFLLGTLVGSAEEVRLTHGAILKSGHNIVSLKAGTMVDLLSRDEKLLTVRFNNVTGTIPASSLAGTAAATESPKPETAKPSAPPRKAETTYGKDVEKAKASVAKHDQNEAKPLDEVMKN